jgi:hypothetical protein
MKRAGRALALPDPYQVASTNRPYESPLRRDRIDCQTTGQTEEVRMDSTFAP